MYLDDPIERNAVLKTLMGEYDSEKDLFVSFVDEDLQLPVAPELFGQTLRESIDGRVNTVVIE